MLRLRRPALPEIPDDHIVRRTIILPRMESADHVLADEQVFLFTSDQENKVSLVWAWLQRFEIQTHCWWSRKLGRDCVVKGKDLRYGGFLRTKASGYRQQAASHRTLVYPDVAPGEERWHASLQLEYLGNPNRRERTVIRARVASELVKASLPIIRCTGLNRVAAGMARMIGRWHGMMIRLMSRS